MNTDTYKKVYNLAGGFTMFLTFVLFQGMTRYESVYQTTLQQQLTEITVGGANDQFLNHFAWMAFISVIGIVLNNLRDLKMNSIKRAMTAKVHNSLLKSVIFAPVNKFFDITPIGKILQIFLDDINVFRGEVIDPMFHMSNMTTHVIVVVSLLVSVAGIKAAACLLFIMSLMRRVSIPYVSADNQLHKVGSTIWGPIRSYFSESMRGTTVIRAFGEEKTILKKQYALMDKSTVHFVAHHSCWSWYNLRMFMLSKSISIFAIVFIVLSKDTTSTASLVLLFNYSIDMDWLMHFFGCYNWFMRSMTRAQRVFNLESVPAENYEKKIDTPANWPPKGEIKFDDVKLKYRDNTDVVLKGLSFTVQPGHKVGIVGRTGAGKSTISMALTRIVELFGGKIEIDGVDVSKVQLEDLRNQITMIPQDPALFTGTLRYNLDPFEEAPDERVLDLVKKAGLAYLLEGTSKKEKEDKEKEEKEKQRKKEAGEIFDSEDDEDDKEGDKKSEDKDKKESKDKDDKKSEDKDEKKEKDDEDDGKGLKFKVQEEGKNLSVGERQLICIIRAILRCNKVVILDEATANIDVITEQTIQKLIAEEFDGATVLTIAHRLNTIIKSDRVLLMD